MGPLVYREKRVVTLREAVPVSIRSQDEEGSSELSEPEDADGPRCVLFYALCCV